MTSSLRKNTVTEASLKISLEGLRNAYDVGDSVWIDKLIPLICEVRTLYEQVRFENIRAEEEHGRAE